MSPSFIRKHQALYRQLDALAAHAYIIGDTRRMDQYLDARNSLGEALREANHSAWSEVRAHRFSPTTPSAQPHTQTHAAA